MRLLAFLLLLPCLAFGQGITTLNNGDPADANTVNANFQHLNGRIQAIEDAGGGSSGYACSVEQEETGAMITCDDGSTAWVPGYGTVVVYPEASSGVIDPSSVTTGDLVLMDANDIVLGQAIDKWNDIYTIALPIPDLGFCYIHVYGGSVGEPISTGSNRGIGYFQSDDCSGQMLIEVSQWCEYIQGNYYFVGEEINGDVLSKSELWSDGCRVQEKINRNSLALPSLITLPPEILNAAYPVRLEQLP